MPLSGNNKEQAVARSRLDVRLPFRLTQVGLTVSGCTLQAVAGAITVCSKPCATRRRIQCLTSLFAFRHGHLYVQQFMVVGAAWLYAVIPVADQTLWYTYNVMVLYDLVAVPQSLVCRCDYSIQPSCTITTRR